MSAERVQLDATMGRLLEHARKRVLPGYEPTYRCSGGCEDTGWVEIDDGLDSDGRRLCAPIVKRCARCGGKSSQSSEPARGASFS